MPLDKEAYLASVRACHTILALAATVQMPLDQVLGAMGRAEGMGPVLDPTLYKDKIKALLEDREVVEAVIPIWHLAQRLKAKERVPGEDDA